MALHLRKHNQLHFSPNTSMGQVIEVKSVRIRKRLHKTTL